MNAGVIDFAMGGGRSHFLPTGTVDAEDEEGARADGRNLAEEIPAEGGADVQNQEEFDAIDPATIGGPVLGLFESSHMMAVVSQVLVAGGVLCGLAIVARLFRRQLALLTAIGAPGRFVVAVVWLYSVAHLIAGAALGLLLGQVAARVLSAVVSRRTGLELTAELGTGELLAVAGFLGLGALAALLPALAAPSGHPAAELR